MSVILLGTVAIEPNRWGLVDSSRRATIDVVDWLDEIVDIGFEGLELWDGHASDALVAAVDDGRVRVPVFNSYAPLDDPDDGARREAAEWVRRLGSIAVKCNVGAEAGPAAEARYAERLAAWSAAMPTGVRLLCECHMGTIAEDPVVAGRVLAAAGPPDRIGAIVHTHDDEELLRRRFEFAGDRIAHVHVNFLDQGRAPRLAEIPARLGSIVELLRSLGFDGTWTTEFVEGVLTDHDEPAALLAQARDDLAVLRELV